MAPKFLIFYSLILLARQVYSALNIEGCPAGTMNVREDDELRLTCGPYDFEMSWYYSRDNTLGELIGHCYGIFCYPAQRHEFAMLGDSYPSIVKSYKSTLLFPTINRDEARVYYCKTNYSMSACRLRVTAPAEVVPENCRVWISDWQVQGECLVERMYASDDVYTCTWSVNNTQVTGVFERPLTTYRNNSRTYMRGVCSFRQEIPFNGYNFTHSISYTYKISIDPGPQDSLVTTINIEPPKKPEINCSETVLEGSTVICMCTSQNRGNPPAKFVWDGTNTDRLLLQNVSRQQSSTNYTCRQTWGPHGVINTTVNYTFTVASPVTHSPDTWKYQCEINENVTDILWILQSTNETETLSRCSVESESCDHRLEDLARATINSTSSFLYISDSFVGQKDGRVGYAEIINGLRGEIRFDARTNPMNRANDPSTETTEQTDASTDSPAATDSLAAWQYQCQIRENVTDVLWILQVGNETETLSRCYIGSESCDQRLDDCAIATINITSSLFNISANLEKVKAGRVGYAEMINGLNGEIRFDAKRNPIKWPCGPLTVTTGIFPSTKQTSESTDYSTGRTSP